MLGEQGDTYFVERALPAAASGANSAIEAVLVNPFPARKAKIVSFEIVPIETITGDDTNTQNYNLQLVAGTEIGNLDFPSGVNGAKGVAKAGTLSGTDAQLTLAVGGAVCVQREEVGTQPVRAVGSLVRIGFRGAGV